MNGTHGTRPMSRFAASGLCKLDSMHRRLLLTRTKFIPVRRLGIFLIRWDNVGSSGDVHAWIVASQVIVIVCAQDGDGLVERLRLGTSWPGRIRVMAVVPTGLSLRTITLLKSQLKLRAGT